MRNTNDRSNAEPSAQRPSTGQSRSQSIRPAASSSSRESSARGFSQFSRTRAGSRYATTHASRRRRKNITRGVFLSLAGVAVLGIGATAIGATTFINSIGKRMNAGVTDETRAALAQQQEIAKARAASNLTEGTTALPDNWEDTTPFYTLLIGTDRSESRSEGDESYLYGESDANYRSDVMILARIDPGNLIVTLVSIERDTLVDIDGRQLKMNSAYSLGGAAKVIEVVSNFAGVPISHYAEVDIDGLAAVTDAMGGVTVNVPYTIDDPYMGHLDAGVQKLNGEQALIFTRSRHAFDYLGAGDRYRAAHQRLFLSAMATQLFASTPQTMISVIDTVANYITTDFTTDQIISLALTMRNMDTSTGIYSTMNPTYTEIIDGIYYEISIDDEWAEMMAVVDSGGKPPVDSEYLDPLDDINSADDGSNSTDNNVAENLDFYE